MQLFAGAAAPTAAGAAADVVKDGSLRPSPRTSSTRRSPCRCWSTSGPLVRPCKQLTPVLEKVVRAAKGKVRLVKVNIDDPQNRPLVEQLRIQSVPMVYAFLGGQPVTVPARSRRARSRHLVDRLVAETGGGAVEDDGLLEAAQIAAAHGDTRTRVRGCSSSSSPRTRRSRRRSGAWPVA